MSQVIVVKLPNDELLRLEVKQFSGDIDLDRIMMIDYSRLKAESVSFPVILNRLGLLVAEAENRVKVLELNFEVWEAETKSQIREELLASKREQKLTDEDIKAKLYAKYLSLPLYKVKKQQIIKAEHERQNISTIFWNAKDKSKKIEVLLDKAQSDELQLEALGEEINGIKISLHRPHIK